jgi:phospholipase/lecithinase/hemolysin
MMRKQQALAVNTIPVQRYKIKSNTKIDLNKLQDMIAKNPNMSERQLAKQFDVSHVSIWEAKQKLQGYDKETIESYSSGKANIFLEGQRRILQEHLTVERIKSMQPHQAALWFNSLYNNWRLETNQSTENTSIITATVKSLRQSLNANDTD